MQQNAVNLYVEDSEAESVPTVDLKDYAPPYLFVYGTLMQGEGNQSCMPSRAKFLGEAQTQPGYSLLDMGLPGLVEDKSGGVVIGEVYEVDEDIIAILDHFEGHPDFYRRGKIRLQGPVMEAWCYFRARGYGKPIPSPASWRNRRNH